MAKTEKAREYLVLSLKATGELPKGQKSATCWLKRRNKSESSKKLSKLKSP